MSQNFDRYIIKKIKELFCTCLVIWCLFGETVQGAQIILLTYSTIRTHTHPLKNTCTIDNRWWVSAPCLQVWWTNKINKYGIAFREWRSHWKWLFSTPLKTHFTVDSEPLVAAIATHQTYNELIKWLAGIYRRIRNGVPRSIHYHYTMPPGEQK